MSDNKSKSSQNGPAEESAPKRTNGELIPQSMGSLQAIPASEWKNSNGRFTASVIPEPMGLLRSLRRRWLVAAVLGTVCAGIVGPATWYILQQRDIPRYTAYALLRM